MVVFEEGQGGCGIWLKMGFSVVEESEKFGGVSRSCRSCAGVSLLRARSALSSGRETATVDAVSLMANQFPGGGVVAVCVCVFVYLDVWGSNRCTEEGRREKKEEERENSYQDALGNPVRPVSGSHNRKSCFHNTATAAVPSWSVPSLLH